MTSADPGSGAQLGPFRLGRRLGVGGMGVVFQALDTQLNRQVALKVITPHIGDDEGFRARFTREAQAQASLDSPHVVQVYSFGEADGRLYIASQLIPDGDLGQMLSRHGRPPARIAVNLIAQVADGLADAHAAGLIHRDIKPANVLLRHRDQVLQAYLGDFGIARQVGAGSQLTQAGGTVGTPSYMAPELHLGADADPASDLYSLGCLLWATLSGRAPYVGSTDYQTVMAHLEKSIPQLAPTGPLATEINRVLRRALAKQPDDRYPSAVTMRDDLRQVVRLPDDAQPVRPLGDDEPTVARPAAVAPSWPAVPPRTPTPTPGPPGPPPPRPASRGGRRWVTVAVVAVVLAVGGAVTAVVLSDGGGEAGGGSGTTTTGTQTGTETGGTTAAISGAEEEQTVENLTAAFLESGDAQDRETSACIARTLVEQRGVDGLQELGMIDEDLQFQADADDPEIGTVVLTAGFSCIGELLSSIPPSP